MTPPDSPADNAVIAPVGELDILASRRLIPLLEQATADTRTGQLIIDLSEVSFVDSSGLGAIFQTHRRLVRQGRFVALVVPPGSAAAVLLDLSGMARRCPTYPTRTAAEDAAANR